MELDTQMRDGAAVIRVDGRLTMASSGSLRGAVDEAVAAGGRVVVLDLSGCAFMDSSGLGAIVGGLKAARQAGGDLRIAAVTPQVATVLELTNLDRVLRPHATVDEALGDS